MEWLTIQSELKRGFEHTVSTILHKLFKHFVSMSIFLLGSGRILCNIWLENLNLTFLKYC